MFFKMIEKRRLIILISFAILHQNYNYFSVVGLSSFIDYRSSNDVFDIIVNYDELIRDGTLSSPSAEDFSLDVVSFYISIIEFER